jgi:hypothetical protein
MRPFCVYDETRCKAATGPTIPIAPTANTFSDKASPNKPLRIIV